MKLIAPCVQPSTQLPLTTPVAADSTIIWGEADRYLGPELADAHEFVSDLTLRRLPGVSHWVQQQAPAEVNRYLLEFFRDVRGASSIRADDPLQ